MTEGQLEGERRTVGEVIHNISYPCLECSKSIDTIRRNDLRCVFLI